MSPSVPNKLSVLKQFLEKSLVHLISIIGVMKWRRLRWAGRVARMGNKIREDTGLGGGMLLNVS